MYCESLYRIGLVYSIIKPRGNRPQFIQKVSVVVIYFEIQKLSFWFIFVLVEITATIINTALTC